MRAREALARSREHSRVKRSAAEAPFLVADYARIGLPKNITTFEISRWRDARCR